MSWDGEPDLENRDPNNLNDHIKVGYKTSKIIRNLQNVLGIEL